MQKIKKTLPVILLFVLVSGLCLHYSLQKKGMFIDEIYSYGLSNSEYNPFISDVCGGNMIDQVLTHREFQDYLSVQTGEQFHFGSVYYNQTQDVHPPLYYWLLHLVSSFFPESYSKWIGLSINYVVFLATLWSLFLLSNCLFGSRKLAGLTVAMYGLSTIALSTFLMIRMYMLLTLFTVLLAYWIACLMAGKKSFWSYALVLITIFLGLMTQYYYVFYAFFACASYGIYLLVKTEYRSFWKFSGAALFGVALFVMLYPACLQHLFADKLVSGGSMLECLMNPSDWPRRLHTMVYGLNYNMRWVGRLGKIAFIPAILFSLWCLVKKQKPGRRYTEAWVLTIPAFLAFAIVTIASPVIPLRYIYNLTPFFACFVSALLAWAFQGIKKPFMKYAEEVAIIGYTIAIVFTATSIQPEFLYPEQEAKNEIVMKYSSSPCVYFDNNFVAPITTDMLQLSLYDDVFVTNDASSEALINYLDLHRENEFVIVYVDDGTNPTWSSQYNEEETIQAFERETGYQDAEEIYEGAWLLRKGTDR